MQIPNAERAEIAREKLTDYLLNLQHRRGAAKAKLLRSCGYSPAQWERLADDLRRQHLTLSIAVLEENDYGDRYVIEAPLATPSGRTIFVRSVWQIDTGSDVPRFITMYPR
jgi:hypothetical protein